MLSSQECLKKIKEYGNAKLSLRVLVNECSVCINTLNGSNKYFEKIIISGEVVGFDNLNAISANLKTIKSYIEDICKECDLKTNFYTEEYKKAVEREKNAAKRNTTSSGIEIATQSSSSARPRSEIRVHYVK